ncbi:hypothetical protein L615_007900000130 [Nocardioides sp. J9]|nr:hypothetical protein L615_007900000130 [Nocardioides sp. J9]
MQAAEWGLAYRSYAADEFDEEVAAFVARLAGRRTDAVRSIKKLVRDGLRGDLGAGLDLEMDTVVAHICGDAGGASVTAFAGRKEEKKS